MPEDGAFGIFVVQYSATWNETQLGQGPGMSLTYLNISEVDCGLIFLSFLFFFLPGDWFWAEVNVEG